MLDQDRVGTFARLFKGRMDAYGTEEGMCQRVAQWAWPTYEGYIENHLNGNHPIGVYPMTPDSEQEWIVYWGCVDFDEGEEISFIHAMNLSTVLDAMDIQSWVERSRSKGYHVWVFAAEAIPAHEMRQALLAACDLANAPTKEINPKSEGFHYTDDNGVTHPDWSKVGNYVRLPYPNGWETNHRRCMVDRDGNPISPDVFVDIAYPTRIERADLQMPLALYRPKVKPVFDVKQIDVNADGLPSTDAMNSVAYKTWLEGPFEGHDRSSALWKMACEIRKSGYPYEQALALVNDADIRWGKHHLRGDEDRIVQMLTKVYAN